MGRYYSGHYKTRKQAIDAANAARERMRPLKKRPVAWRVKDFADGWIIFQDEEAANREAEATGAAIHGLYVRDGT